MLREIDGGGLVGGGGVIDAEGVAVGERVGDGDPDGAGVTLGAVGIGERKFEGRPVGTFGGLGGPQAFVVADEPAVEVIGAVIGGQRVVFSVEGEFPFGDAVSDAADECAEVWAGCLVIASVVEAQDNVSEGAVFV